jgi:hypothetical protein
MLTRPLGPPRPGTSLVGDAKPRGVSTKILRSPIFPVTTGRRLLLGDLFERQVPMLFALVASQLARGLLEFLPRGLLLEHLVHSCSDFASDYQETRVEGGHRLDHTPSTTCELISVPSSTTAVAPATKRLGPDMPPKPFRELT